MPEPQLENLLFATSRVRSGDGRRASLWMIDLVTLRRVELARGGPGAEQLIATRDGRLLIANGDAGRRRSRRWSRRRWCASRRPTARFVPLPLGEIGIVFDHDMLASSANAADSVTNSPTTH